MDPFHMGYDIEAMVASKHINQQTLPRIKGQKDSQTHTKVLDSRSLLNQMKTHRKKQEERVGDGLTYLR